MIHVVHQRLQYKKGRTPGAVSISRERICAVVEDELFELPGVPVTQWKLKNKAAIPAGHYDVTLRGSKLVLAEVGGFGDIWIDASDGAGLKIGADDQSVDGKLEAEALMLRLLPALKAGERVVWDIRNPDGYVGPLKAKSVASIGDA